MEKAIFLVDDEVSILRFLKKAFETKGYSVITAESGEEALEILSNASVQVMFLDLRLPEMNGIELCREIRKDNHIACIYAMTGFSSLFDLSDCREAGFDDYFLKPIDLDTFFKAAEVAFEKLERWKHKTD